MAVASFDDITLRSVSDVLSGILTHRQISEYFDNIGFQQSQQGTNKTDRVFYTLKERQVQDKCGNNVLAFLLQIFTPRRYETEAEFESHRTRINEKLLYVGIEIDGTGKAKSVTAATTISEAKERSQRIKEKIRGMYIHGSISHYCQEEWLKENYFHAILEVTKSVAEHLREISSLNTDGTKLVDDCFTLGANNQPMIAFNALQTESERSEHTGFANFIRGFFSMYRNPKAHIPKVNDPAGLEDLAEVLIVATIIHNKLDKTVKTGFR